MKVDIVNQETIKPSFPTPSHLRTHNISVLDQVAIPIYISHILMYPASLDDAGYHHFSQTLKRSLSDTLTVFPPLAGRFKDNVSVACNDHGVLCYETRVRSTMDRLLLDVHSESLESLVAGAGAGGDINAVTGVQLLVQINLFDCGGIAIGFSFSHKTGDLSTSALFLKTWSDKAINSSSGESSVVPDFTLAKKIPSRKHVSVDGGQNEVVQPAEAINQQELSAVRLVFGGPELAALKAKSASQGTPQPTRVEAVSARIGKCAVTASITANNDNKRDPPTSYLFANMVNMREKLSLPETTFGNVVGGYAIPACCPDPSDLDVLVDKLRKGRMEYYDSLAANGGKVIHDMIETVEAGGAPGGTELYVFTSWCRFGLYEVDFGLGKPKWVGRPLNGMKNYVWLMDADGSNNRVEAHITLTKQDMDLFRVDPLLLKYASVNPAI